MDEAEKQSTTPPPVEQYSCEDYFQTPRKVRHVPNSKFHPYSSPRRVSGTSLKGFSSPGRSPYLPLSEKQIRRLKEETKKTKSQLELFSDLCAHLYGERPDNSELVAGLGAVLDAKPGSRTFSALTAEDYFLLNPGESGSICYNEEQLHKHIPDTKIPIDFWPSLQTLRHTFSRRMEMGVRQIIGHFLAYAVKIAQSHFNDAQRLVIHSEVDLPVVHVPEIGPVKGPLDYLTCYAAGAMSMSKCS